MSSIFNHEQVMWSVCGLHRSGNIKYCLIILIRFLLYSKDAMARVFFYRSCRRRKFARNLAKQTFRFTSIVEMMGCVCCVSLFFFFFFLKNNYNFNYIFFSYIPATTYSIVTSIATLLKFFVFYKYVL